MVGEVAVHFKEKLVSRAAQPFQNGARHHAAGAVSRVNGHLHGAGDGNVINQIVAVRCYDVVAFHRPFAAGEAAFFYQPAKVLDLLAKDGLGSQRHLETVVFGRVVARGDHQPAVGLEVVEGKVEDRRRANSEIDDPRSRLDQSFCERVADPRRTKAAVTADNGRRSLVLLQVCAIAPADFFNIGHIEIAVYDPAHVILSEYFLFHSIRLRLERSPEPNVACTGALSLKDPCSGSSGYLTLFRPMYPTSSCIFHFLTDYPILAEYFERRLSFQKKRCRL